MTRMRITVTGLLLALTCATFAQETDEYPSKFKSLSLSWGYHHLAFQDKLLSPLVNTSGSVLNGTLEYRWGTESHEFFMNGSYTGYSAGKNETYTYLSWPEAETREIVWTTMTRIDLGFGMLWSIAPAKKLGFHFNNQFRLIDYGYGKQTIFTYFFNQSFGPKGVWEFDIGERSGLTLGLTVPLVSWVSRSAYSITDDEYIKNNSDQNGFKAFGRYIGGGDMAFVWDFQEVLFHVRYAFDLNDRWTLGAGYLLEFYHYDEPRSVLSYSNNFDITATFNF